MGLDIFGFIECQVPNWRPGEPPVHWRPAMELDLLTDTRDYDAFGCLFGIRNHANFRPVVPVRGLPKDVSEQVRLRSENRQIYTWVSWAEIKAVDWDEPAQAPDSRVHEYRRQPDGSLKYKGKAAWTSGFEEVTGTTLEEVIDGPPSWQRNQEWTKDDRVFRAETLRRRDAIPAHSEWQGVWLVMEVLAERYGDDCVRLVVWFD